MLLILFGWGWCVVWDIDICIGVVVLFLYFFISVFIRFDFFVLEGVVRMNKLLSSEVIGY